MDLNRINTAAPHLGEHPEHPLGLLDHARAVQVLAALGIQEAVLPVEEAGLIRSAGGTHKVAGSLQGACARQVQLRERRRVRDGGVEQGEGFGGLRWRVVLREEVECPQVCGRLDVRGLVLVGGNVLLPEVLD